MQKRKNNLKYTKVFTMLLFTLVVGNVFSQERVKLDGIAAQIGSEIVLDSDIAKFKKGLEEQSRGQVKISEVEMLEELMMQKLLAHNAIIDSVLVSDDLINANVDRTLANLVAQLGDKDKVVEMYGFNNEKDLKEELIRIERESNLVSEEQANITKNVSVSPAEINTYYMSLKESNSLPTIGDEVELAQIVVYAKPEQYEIDKVVEELTSIREDILNGSSMKMKAILYSEDPAVSSTGMGNGGEYEITRDGGFVKEFKETAFSLKEGEISEPFPTKFGYHILKIEKVMGQKLKIRHIIMAPKISDLKLNETKTKLEKLKKDITSGVISFEKAVIENSEDNETRLNDGVIINPMSKDTKFDITKLDPVLHGQIVNLKQGEFSDVFFTENREGEKMFKLVLVKSKTPSHQADIKMDYVTLQHLALEKKKQKEVDKWTNERIKTTYIKIGDAYKDWKFKKNWLKK